MSEILVQREPLLLGALVALGAAHDAAQDEVDDVFDSVASHPTATALKEHIVELFADAILEWNGTVFVAPQ